MWHFWVEILGEFLNVSNSVEISTRKSFAYKRREGLQLYTENFRVWNFRNFWHCPRKVSLLLDTLSLGFKPRLTWCDFCWTTLMYVNIHGNRSMLEHSTTSVNYLRQCWTDVHTVSIFVGQLVSTKIHQCCSTNVASCRRGFSCLQKRGDCPSSVWWKTIVFQWYGRW